MEGQAVYRSADTTTWERQPGENLLAAPGSGEDDGGRGHHADVVVSDGRAWIFYFSPSEVRVGVEPPPGANTRRTTIHVAELVLGADGWLGCNRDAPAVIALRPPLK